MKTSGNKVMIIFSVVILGSMLIVPVLPAGRYFFNDNANQKEIDMTTIEMSESFDSSNVSVDFSIGREISIRL